MEDRGVQPQWFTVKEAEAYFGMSRSWIYQNKRRFKWKKFGRRNVRIERKSIDDFIATQPSPH
jgi:predicted DNA-binding transcriptional regulator AlpA